MRLHAVTSEKLALLDLKQVITCGYTRSHTVKYGHMRSHTVTYGYMRLHTVTCGYMRLHAITCGYTRLHAVTCGHMRLHAVTCRIKSREASTRFSSIKSACSAITLAQVGTCSMKTRGSACNACNGNNA